MKIGILTFHDGLNHGAYLQVFSTMTYLNSNFDNVEILNYKNKFHHRQEGWKQIFKYRNPIRIIDYLQKKASFLKDQKRLTLTKFTTSHKKIKRLKFDIIIIGSDVIWNSSIFGEDDIYFGNVFQCKQIAFSASFGWYKPDVIKYEYLKKSFKNFINISVRDIQSQKIVEDITNFKPQMNLDPTFIIDWKKYEKISSRITRLKPYILIYAYSLSDDEIKLIKVYAKKRDLICISVGYRQKWCDKNIIDVGPFEWLGFIKQSQCIITSTFHGTIFSNIYNKPFCVSINKKNSERIKSLLHELDLKDNILPNIEQSLKHKPNNMYRLENKVTQTKTWLLEAISKIV
tara:strand:- start:639 stop:1670 length:1032 start_codon:yes stop_codon:yes gene_type:complete